MERFGLLAFSIVCDDAPTSINVILIVPMLLPPQNHAHRISIVPTLAQLPVVTTSLTCIDES